MTAFLRIDQAGLAPGTPGRSRTDGEADGSLVTLTDTSPGSGSTEMRLLWTPPQDTGAVSSFEVTGDPKVWTFAPTAGKVGTYHIELVRNAGLVTETSERRVIVMRTPNYGLIIPALNERGYQSASLIDSRGDELVDNNATDFADPDLNELPFASWWRAMHELILQVDSAVARESDGSVSLDISDPSGNFSFTAVNGARLQLANGAFVVGLDEVGVPFNVISAQKTGGGVVVLGFFGADPVSKRSITGTTTQEQVDSLVAALAALGLASDDR